MLTDAIVNKVSDARAIPPEIPANNFIRSFKPRFGDIEQLRDVTNNARVIGESGKSYALRYVKPKPSESEPAEPQAVSGSAQHSGRARRELQAFATRVQTHFASQTPTLHAVAKFLRSIRGFNDATRRARIRQRTRVVSCLRNFPELFTVESTLGTGRVTVSP